MVFQRFCSSKSSLRLLTREQGLILYFESVCHNVIPGLLFGDIHDKKIFFCPDSVITEQ